MTITNHSNRQPIGNKLIVFLDEVGAWKDKRGNWVTKEGGFLIISDQQRDEMARRATSGIILAMSKNCFKDVSVDERPIIGDRVTFTSYSGLHKIEGDNFYRSLTDTEIHDWYIPQRKQLIESTKTKKKKK